MFSIYATNLYLYFFLNIKIVKLKLKIIYLLKRKMKESEIQKAILFPKQQHLLRKMEVQLKVGNGLFFDKALDQTYCGAFKNDKKNGYGEITYKNGATYRGQWENDLKQGSGVYIWPDFTSYDGNWKKMQWKDQTYYIIQMKQYTMMGLFKMDNLKEKDIYTIQKEAVTSASFATANKMANEYITQTTALRLQANGNIIKNSDIAQLTLDQFLQMHVFNQYKLNHQKYMQSQQMFISQEIPVSGLHQQVTSSFRCYLRRPNMQAEVQNISVNQSVQQLKYFIIAALKLTINADALKLVVNEVQLKDVMLRDHLHQNAIIHVLLNFTEQQENSQSQFSLKIKQPPMSCPVYELPSISVQLTVQNVKQRIHQFYVNDHSDEDLARLDIKQIYLVYGGQILQNNRTLKSYQIDKNGIVYVVNGHKYVKQVTRQEAERRIREVRNKQITQPSIVHAQVSQSKEEQQANVQNQSSEIHPSENQDDFVIVQNMVFNQDSDGQNESQVVNENGESSPTSMSRSQKIIHRYDSIKNNQDQDKIDDTQKQFISQLHQVSEGSELDQHRTGRTAALQNYLPASQEHIIKVQEEIQHQESKQQVLADKNTISEYVQSISQKASQIQQLQNQTPQHDNSQNKEHEQAAEDTQQIQVGQQDKNQPEIMEDQDLLDI